MSRQNRSAKEYRDMLLGLLAFIHRDGGHHVALHGLEKAVTDAEMRVARLNHLDDTLDNLRAAIAGAGSK